MSKKIIAVDFDGCLVTDCFPDIGMGIYETILRLQEEQRKGAKTILWTCRRDEQLASAIEWCEYHCIYFDAVNENLPEIIKDFGSDTRKIFAHEYWDDRAVRMPSV